MTSRFMDFITFKTFRSSSKSSKSSKTDLIEDDNLAHSKTDPNAVNVMQPGLKKVFDLSGGSRP